VAGQSMPHRTSSRHPAQDYNEPRIHAPSSARRVSLPAPAPRALGAKYKKPKKKNKKTKNASDASSTTKVDLWLSGTHGLQIGSRHQHPWAISKIFEWFAEDWGPPPTN